MDFFHLSFLKTYEIKDAIHTSPPVTTGIDAITILIKNLTFRMSLVANIIPSMLIQRLPVLIGGTALA
jgi:hypothetical protein